MQCDARIADINLYLQPFVVRSTLSLMEYAVIPGRTFLVLNKLRVDLYRSLRAAFRPVATEVIMPPLSGLPALSVQYSREQAAQVSAENQFFRRVGNAHSIDHLIPFGESQHRGRPHSSLGLGIPDRPQARVPPVANGIVLRKAIESSRGHSAQRKLPPAHPA